MLLSEKRKTTKPGKVKWLLSYLATCHECGGPLSASQARKGIYPVPMYRCYRKRCCAIGVDVLDAFVESSVVTWLSRKDVYAVLEAAYGANDEDLAKARAEVTRLETDLTEWLKDASANAVKAATVARFEADYDQRIAAAKERAQALSLPSALRAVAGPQAAEKWAAITDVATKREIVRSVATVAVTRALVRDRVPVEDRVVWGGLIGGQTAA